MVDVRWLEYILLLDKLLSGSELLRRPNRVFREPVGSGEQALQHPYRGCVGVGAWSSRRCRAQNSCIHTISFATLALSFFSRSRCAPRDAMNPPDCLKAPTAVSSLKLRQTLASLGRVRRLGDRKGNENRKNQPESVTTVALHTP